MSIEEAARAVPDQLREQFLIRARAVSLRARERGASSIELGLALGVLVVLCGGSSGVAPVEGT